MDIPDFIRKNKKVLLKTTRIISIGVGAILLFNFKMVIAGTLLLVLGYFSELKND